MIYFIEGISGVGKTTTTTLLQEKLHNSGHDAYCYLEGAPDNPLDPFGGTYPPAMPLSSFSETYLKCWRNFAGEHIKQDFLLILDGTLFHHQINDMLREYNAPDDVIINHLSALLHVIQQFNPVVFYLSTDDVGQRLHQARASRNQSVPTEEGIAFWENRKRVDLHALAALPVKSHIFAVDNGWDMPLETMVSILCSKH